MSHFKVLILTGDDPELYRSLQSDEVEVHVRRPGDPVPEIAEVEAVVAGWFSAELLEKAQRLKYFLVPFAGLPPDLKELLERRPGLSIANSHYNADFVAEHVFAMIFHLCRNLTEMDRFMRRRRIFRRRRPPVEFIALKGKTMGIFGRGHIGRSVERKAAAFGMRCLSYSRSDHLRDRKEKKELYEFLHQSAFVVLALPLTEATRGIIGSEEFLRMGSETILINVSRGEIVQEEALFEALQQNRIRGAGVDAWYNYVDGYFSAERPYTLPFDRLSNIVMTPHVAYRGDTLEHEKIESVRTFIAEAAMGGEISNRVDPARGY